MTREKRAELLAEAYNRSFDLQVDAARLEGVLRELEEGGYQLTFDIKQAMAFLGTDAMLLNDSIGAAVYKEEGEDHEG